MVSKKYISCEDLQGSVYFAPRALRHCCQRFFVNGKMQGDVEIFKINNSTKINYTNILEKKNELVKKLNNKEKTPCDGCPKLENKIWDNFKIKKISIEVHSKCNARCSYCSDIFYGGLNPIYKITEIIDELKKESAFDDEVSLTWGGGEPVLLKDFDEMCLKILSIKKPKFDDVRIYSNSFIYNKTIKKFLDNKRIILTTSTDCGTQETFEKVRGVKKGFLDMFNNLKKYSNKSPEKVIIKYIITDDNKSLNEIKNFVNLIEKYKLQKCNFEISTDYKNENLSLKTAKSLIYFYNLLSKKGAKFVFFDDHVLKRIVNVIKENNLEKEILNHIKIENNNIVIWGTGYYAKYLLRKSIFLKKKNISFFVDKKNIGKNFMNYKVKEPESILKNKNSILIASSTYWREIYNHIVDLGVDKRRIIRSLVI